MGTRHITTGGSCPTLCAPLCFLRLSELFARPNSPESPELSEFGANVYAYAVTACPCRVRPLCQFSEMRHVPLDSAVTSAFCPNAKNHTQVNRQDDLNVIRVSVLHRTIGYVAARPLRYRPRIFNDCPGWGIDMGMSQGKHRLSHQSDVKSRVTPVRSRTSRSSMRERSFRSAASSTLAFAASCVSIALVLPSGFVAGSSSSRA